MQNKYYLVCRCKMLNRDATYITSVFVDAACKEDALERAVQYLPCLIEVLEITEVDFFI